jgi:hypothetical protein
LRKKNREKTKKDLQKPMRALNDKTKKIAEDKT